MNVDRAPAKKKVTSIHDSLPDECMWAVSGRVYGMLATAHIYIHIACTMCMSIYIYTILLLCRHTAVQDDECSILCGYFRNSSRHTRELCGSLQLRHVLYVYT